MLNGGTNNVYVWVWVVVKGWGRVGGMGARVKAVREMPRPCVESVEQAQVTILIVKSSLTSDIQCTSNSC